MNFLDKTGLTHFWSKIKTLINNKQNKITYGTSEPSGGVDGDVYLMPVDEVTADKVGDLSTLTTEEQSSVVGALNEINSPGENFSDKVTFNETPASYHFYKKNGVVCITYQGASTTHAVGVVLFTIPEGYRPKMLEGQNQFFFPFVKNNVAYGVCWIRISNGECIMSQISNTSTNGRIYFSISYVCE